MRFSPFLLLSLLLLGSCAEVSTKKRVPLVEGLPTMENLAQRLNDEGAKVVKWAVNDSAVIYSDVESVDWMAELEPFMKADVNDLRYREAFDVVDTMIGTVRSVTFKALSPKQEVKLMEVHIVNDEIEYFEVERSRENVFSSSYQHFKLDRGTYVLEVEQDIPFVFSNRKLLVGTIIENGDLWRGSLSINGRELPFRFILNTESDPQITVKNGVERVGFHLESHEGEQWVFQSDYFNSRFEFSFENDSILSGSWINSKRDVDEVIPFRAERGVAHRFKAEQVPSIDLSGQHSAVFYSKDGSDKDSTLLVLKQIGPVLSGSFLTETGDYRFLQGAVRNDSVFLSSLDGTHAYLFEGALTNGDINGEFFSGLKWHQAWESTPNESSQLGDPETMTSIRTDSSIAFSFPDSKGQLVNLEDEAYRGKALAISLMGTWCSNCLDEAVFLKEAHEQYRSQGFEVIALDFELTTDSAKAFENIVRHEQNLELDYPVLLASLGSTKRKAAELLPFLSGFYSYPTLILLDKQHRVVKVHTGFSGPASGKKHYEVFRQKYLQLIDSLVRQPA